MTQLTHHQTPSATHRALDGEMIARYRRDGFLLLPPQFLTGDVLGRAHVALPGVLRTTGPERVLERDETTVRSVYGVHRIDAEMGAVSRHPAVLGAVEQLVGDAAYIHQSKVNVKAPFAGDQWEWHQDFVYWLRNDGVARPDMVNVAVFLDEVTEFNGPLTFIPGSHTHGVLSGTTREEMPRGYEDSPSWVATLTADEQFQVAPQVISDLCAQRGMVSPKGPAGSVLFFHPNILHASSPNISPRRRAMLLFVYNAVGNAPTSVPAARPQFLAETDTAALHPIAP